MQKNYISIFLSWFSVKLKNHRHDWDARAALAKAAGKQP
jgi:hypothetical protein